MVVLAEIAQVIAEVAKVIADTDFHIVAEVAIEGGNKPKSVSSVVGDHMTRPSNIASHSCTTCQSARKMPRCTCESSQRAPRAFADFADTHAIFCTQCQLWSLIADVAGEDVRHC